MGIVLVEVMSFSKVLNGFSYAGFSFGGFVIELLDMLGSLLFWFVLLRVALEIGVGVAKLLKEKKTESE
ncbi:hypothetical protein EII42_10450 [Tessaracoccus sp. OH4464_COT-324]|nr:hypothetical protein EII42_10450 [Tessaracoccus sp. OH4464_COT-324]